MIRITRIQQGYYTPNELCNRFPDQTIVFAKIGQNFLALLTNKQHPLTKHDLAVVLCTEKEPIPLYKQAMQLHMGRIPCTHREETKQYRPIIFSKEQANNHRFSLCEFTNH